MGRRQGRHTRKQEAVSIFLPMLLLWGDGQHEKEMVESHKEARSIFDFSSHAVTVG